MSAPRKTVRGAEFWPSAPEINAEIQGAAGRLREALLAGAPTAPIRDRIGALKAAAARLAAERAEAEAQRQADEAAAVASAAETIAAQASGRLAARTPRPISNPVKDRPPMQHAPAITFAARQVAEAATRATAADAQLAGATEAEILARTRLDTLAAQRATIVARRQSGQHDAADGAHLALLAADGEGLAPLLAEAQAAAGTARAEANEARRVLAVARDALAHAEAEQEVGLVVAHLGALDGAVVASLGRLNELQGALHRSGLPYVPSKQMAHGLRRLLAAAGRL